MAALAAAELEVATAAAVAETAKAVAVAAVAEAAAGGWRGRRGRQRPLCYR